MEHRYFKRNWDELRGDEYDNWGTSIWYFEVGADGYVVKQIEVYQNGEIIKYDEANPQDEYGGLSDQPLELDEFEGFDIIKDEFESVWLKKDNRF